MRDQLAEEEQKGRYCRFVRTADGKVALEPVKVPMHIKQERAERIRQRELRQRIEQNRAREQALNIRFVLFLALSMAVCCMVCYMYLSFRGEVSSRLNRIAWLQAQIETAASDNDIIQKRIGQRDLSEIRKKAVSELGMQEAKPKQIIYYSMEYSDYMLQFDDFD